jgi:hypothetical protein
MRRFMTAPVIAGILLLAGLSGQAQQTRAYRGTFASVRQVILRLENRANQFRTGVDAGIRRTNSAYLNNDLMTTARDFNESVRRLRDRFDRRQATSSEVQDVLTQGSRIDDLVRRNTLDTRTLNLWSSIRADLNQLAGAYSLSWQSPGYPPSGDRYDVRDLTGTFRLDRSRSEDARTAVERVGRNLPYNERTRILDIVSRRLDSPDQLAIDVRGRTVTLASTKAPQVTLEADGREHVETGPNGGTMRSRASISGDQLTIDSTGNRGNEFHVVFDPINNGRTLNVTRRIYSPELNQTVEVRSTYDKVSDVARFDIFNGSDTQYPGPANGNFIVPDGTRLVAVLNNDLSTRSAAAGDRFTMRVTDPVEFQGATIEGHVASIQRSGRLTGRSTMTLDFDSIRLRDGRSYQFAGLLQDVVAQNGERVRVDTEGAVRDQSQTSQTGQRAAMGTAVGAIIGAIAGGGKGAAIGAIIGAGTGAGSVYVQGRNDLELNRGSQLIIRAGAPIHFPR